MIDLEGKVFIITGGNGGIGLGMAEGIAMSGGSVAIWGRKAEKNAARAEKQSLRNVNSAYDVFSASISRVADFLRSATTIPWNAGPIKFSAMA